MKYNLSAIACSLILLSGCDNSQPNNGFQPQPYNQSQPGPFDQQGNPNSQQNQQNVPQQGPQQQAPQMPVASATQQASAPSATGRANSAARKVKCSVNLDQYSVSESGACNFEQKNGNGSFYLDNFASGSSIKSAEVVITSKGEADLYVNLGGSSFDVGKVRRKGACWIGVDFAGEVCAR